MKVGNDFKALRKKLLKVLPEDKHELVHASTDQELMASL